VKEKLWGAGKEKTSLSMGNTGVVQCKIYGVLLAILIQEPRRTREGGKFARKGRGDAKKKKKVELEEKKENRRSEVALDMIDKQTREAERENKKKGTSLCKEKRGNKGKALTCKLKRSEIVLKEQKVEKFQKKNPKLGGNKNRSRDQG